MTRKYYSLRFERDDTLHRHGDQVLNADNPLRIGQTASCDIRIDNPSQFEDAILAIIEKRPDDNGWKLIRMSPYKEHEIRVNGTPIDYVHFLNNGDRIAFEGQEQELLFNIHENNLYTTGDIVQIHTARSTRILLAWLLVLTLGISGVVFYKGYTRPITRQMVEQAKSSVFQIKVDSIQLLSIHDNDTLTLSSCPMNVTGTAFLTSDSLLVTARHCIEPWLNISDTVRLDTTSSTLPLYVKWALQAVTNNIVNEGGPSRWEMVSYCSVMQMTPEPRLLFSVKSSQFIIDNSRDLISEHGDFNHQYFWRSLSARPPRVNMMLGDIAYLPIVPTSSYHPTGGIHLASKKVMRKISKDNNNQIAVLGFPRVEVGVQEIERTEGVLKRTIRMTHEGYPKYVLSHNGNLCPGYSGGPVLIKRGFHWYVIGVISVTDKYEKDHFYSVPVTEIERMREKLKRQKP